MNPSFHVCARRLPNGDFRVESEHADARDALEAAKLLGCSGGAVDVYVLTRITGSAITEQAAA